MSKKMYSINVLSPSRWKGGWTVRFLNEGIINTILSSEYIISQYPIKLISSLLMEEVTVISKNQKTIFTNVKMMNSKLNYQKLHIVSFPEHEPMEIFDLSTNEFQYEGFHEISKMKCFNISLFETFDMRNMYSELLQVVSQIKKAFAFHTEIDALNILNHILSTLGVSLNDIEFLELPDFLEVRNGQVIFTKKITSDATIIYSTTEACYIEKSFRFQYDIGNLIEKCRRSENDNCFENNIIEFKDNSDDGYSLTIFGNSNIRNLSPKSLFDKAMVEINRYAKEMNTFNLINSEIEPGN